MTKYNLWSTNQRSAVEIIDVGTGSLHGHTNSNYIYNYLTGNSSFHSMMHDNSISPTGEYIIQSTTQYSETYGVLPHIVIHQSQSSAGFKLNGTSSASAVWSSLMQPEGGSGTNQYQMNANHEWISNNEIAILIRGGYKLSGSHSFTGASFPTGAVDGPGGNHAGLFIIMSGSGSDWQVTQWFTGSTTSTSISNGNTGPTTMAYYDYICINNKYSTTETDRIMLTSTGRNSGGDNYDNRMSFFKKVSGSWQWDGDAYAGNTGRQVSYAVQNAEWIGPDQDQLMFNWRYDSGHYYAFYTYQPDRFASNDAFRWYTPVGETPSNSTGFAYYFAWDPYNEQLATMETDRIQTYNWTGSSGTTTFIETYADSPGRNDLVADMVGFDFSWAPYLNDNDDAWGGTKMQWRFRSGSLAAMYVGGPATSRTYNHIDFIESGSYGWLGRNIHEYSNENRGPLGWGLTSASLYSTNWPGGNPVHFHGGPLATGTGYHRLATISYKEAGKQFHWNTTKGGTSDLLFYVEQGTSTSNYMSGRTILIDLHAYDVTPQEWTPLGVESAGTTSYEISSSVATGITFTNYTASFNADGGNYKIKGGRFSPDGTRIAQPTFYHGGKTATDGGFNYGVNIYQSSSNGWEFETFLSGGYTQSSANSTYLIKDVYWVNNGTLFASPQANLTYPQYWKSGSGGWNTTATQISAPNKSSGTATKSETRYNNAFEASDDGKIIALWAADGGGVDTYHQLLTIVSSSGEPSTWNSYFSNEYMGGNTGDEMSFRYVGKTSNDEYKFAHFRNGSYAYEGYLFLIESVSGSGGDQVASLAEHGASNSGQYFHMISYLSSSNSVLLADHRPGNWARVKEVKVSPHGDLKRAGSDSYNYQLENPWLSNTEESGAVGSTSWAANQSKMKNLAHDRWAGDAGSNGEISIYRSSQWNFPGNSGRSFADPNDPEQRVLWTAPKYNSSNGNREQLRTMEKGADGWKYTTIVEEGSTDSWSSSYIPERIRHDISIKGDILIPVSGSNSSGFAIARISGIGNAADPALENASSTAITAASGGTVSAGGTQSTPRASVSIPAGALSTDTTIGVDTSDSSSPGQLGLGQFGNESLSPLVSLTPHGTKFSSAVTVTFNLIGSGDGVCPANAQLWKRNGPNGSFYPVPSNLWSCTDGVVTLSTTSFSDYIIIGGQQVARTRLKNIQLQRLEDNNKVLPEAINITGSSESYITSVSSTDAFILQSTSGFTAPISASAMAAYFSSASAATTIDVTAISTDSSYSILFTDGTTGASLSKDNDSLTFNPSTNALTTGILTASSGLTVTAGGATVTAGGLTVSAGGANITGDVTASADLRTNGGQLITNQSILNIGTDSDVDALRVGSSNVNVSLSFGASSTSSGAFTVAGGVGIGEKLFVGNQISGSGDLLAGGDLTIKGTGSIGGDLTVTGDLIIQGSTTTVDTQNLLVEDPLIQLGSSSAGNVATDGDRGLVLSLTGSSNKAVFWDDSASQFAFVNTTSTGADTTIAVSSYADLRVLALSASAVSASAFVGDGSGLSGVGASVANEAASGTDHFLTFVAATSSAASFLIESGSLKYNPSADKLFVPNLSASANIDVAGTLGVAGIASFTTHISASGDVVLDTGNIIVPEFGTIGSANDTDAMLFRSARIEISKTGEANSHTDAALTVAGGVGIGKGIYVSGSTTAIGAVSMSNTLDVTGIASFTTHISASGDLVMDTGNIIVPIGGTIGASNDTDAIQINSGRINITKTGEANSHTDAALVVAGGIGIGKGLYVSGAAVTMPGLGDLAVSAGDATHFVLVQDSDDGIVKKESVGDLVSAITGSGIQAASGILSITYVEDFATKYATGSVLSSDFMTASLSQEPLADSVQIYLNGMLLVASGSGREVSSSAGGVAAVYDYIYTGSVGARKAVFVDAVDDDDVIQIKYIKK